LQSGLEIATWLQWPKAGHILAIAGENSSDLPCKSKNKIAAGEFLQLLYFIC
jgi:hypothetical protein